MKLSYLIVLSIVVLSIAGCLQEDSLEPIHSLSELGSTFTVDGKKDLLLEIPQGEQKTVGFLFTHEADIELMSVSLMLVDPDGNKVPISSHDQNPYLFSYEYNFDDVGYSYTYAIKAVDSEGILYESDLIEFVTVTIVEPELVELCGDRQDNDNDGIIDCDDEDCFNDAICNPVSAQVQENTCLPLYVSCPDDETCYLLVQSEQCSALLVRCRDGVCKQPGTSNVVDIGCNEVTSAMSQANPGDRIPVSAGDYNCGDVYMCRSIVLCAE